LRTSDPAPAWKARLQRVGRSLEQPFKPINDALSDPGDPDAPEAPEGEAYFLLNSRHPRTTSGLLIDLYQRQPLRSGKLGKVKRLALKEEMIPSFRSPEEREALSLLLATPDPRPELTGAYAYSSYHHRAGRQRALLPDALAELILPKLAATGRFFLYDDDAESVLETTRSLGWDDGPPWRPEIEVKIVEGDALVTGSLVRGRESRPPRDLRMVLKSGCALFSHSAGDSGSDGVRHRHGVPHRDGDEVGERLEYCWGRLHITPAHPWLWELAVGGTLRVPADEVDEFLGDLWQQPSPQVLDLPEDMRLEPTQLEPRPKLVVSEALHPFHKNHRLANASFEYEGRRLDLDGIWIDQDGEGGEDEEAPTSWADVAARKVFLRDPDLEQKARTSLFSKGFQENPSYLGLDEQLHISPKKFLPAINELLQEGWEITSEEGAYHHPSTSRFQVSLQQDGPQQDGPQQDTTAIDWFTVEGFLRFGDQEVGLPELLQGMRGGKRLIPLKDGSTGVLPEAWHTRLQELGDLAIRVKTSDSSEAESGALRFLPSQTLLLDALLSAQEGSLQEASEFDRTAHFLRLREQMLHLREAEPVQEPKAFRGELRPYQRAGLGWLNNLASLGLGGCLADDMGLGKTIQVLALLQSRREARKKTGRPPSLAVVPKSLVHNWIDEAARFTPDLQVFEWGGKDRVQRWRKAQREGRDLDLIVTTYGTLRRDIETFRRIELDIAILDEAQAIKNSQSQTAKACRLLPAPLRLALTGTPVENSLGDLWSIFEFLNPGMLGRSKVFLDLIKARSLTQEEAELLRTVLGPFILRRTKEEVLPDLPAKTEQVLLCDLAGTERRLYDQLRTHYHRQLREKIESAGIKRSKIHVLEALLRLRQAACHPGLLKAAHEERKGSKIQVLLDHLQDATGAGHKSLVFSQFTSFLALVRRHLDDLGLPYLYLDGKTRNRKKLVDTFQKDPKVPVFLISLKAGGSGLNLTAADYVFLLDPWWNPAVERQAIDRTHRIGQTRPVLAYRLIATDTVEEKVLALQESKQQLAEAILTQNDSVLRQLTQEDLDFLLS